MALLLALLSAAFARDGTNGELDPECAPLVFVCTSPQSCAAPSAEPAHMAPAGVQGQANKPSPQRDQEELFVWLLFLRRNSDFI